jgi:diaminopimelate decarboxylase
MDVHADHHLTTQELVAARPSLAAHAQDGLLFDGVPLAAIAEAYGTPTYITGAATLRHRAARLRAAMGPIAIHYAVKANGHLAILSLLAAEGIGADVVSAGELLRARAAGMPAARIIFSGVGKTRAELTLALTEGVGQINLESAEELHELSALAAAMGLDAPVALRVNPDVDAGTLDQISTGRAGDKFGVPITDAASLYAAAASLPGIRVTGLAVHIGSQIFGTAAFAAAYGRMADLVRTLRAQGLRVDSMDCGGGLGIAYANEPETLPEAWAGAINRAFAGLDLRLAIEPGRWLVGPAGLLLARVIRTRRAGMPRPIVILDAAMNDLPRPAIYGAWHAILPVSATALAAAPELADIAGPVCESTDFLARSRPLANLPNGALVTILDCGAYCASMSSTYNARPPAAQVLVDPSLAGRGGPGHTLITSRPAPASLWAGETVPHAVES